MLFVPFVTNLKSASSPLKITCIGNLWILIEKFVLNTCSLIFKLKWATLIAKFCPTPSNKIMMKWRLSRWWKQIDCAHYDEEELMSANWQLGEMLFNMVTMVMTMTMTMVMLVKSSLHESQPATMWEPERAVKWGAHPARPEPEPAA